MEKIYLRASSALQGDHEVMDLATGRVICQPKVTVCGMIPTVITKAEEMAKPQGIQS